MFFVGRPEWIGALCAVEVGALIFLGHPVATITRTLRKLFFFLAVILIAYSLVEGDPGTARWVTLEMTSIASWLSIEVNKTGALEGLVMVLRVVAIVLASHLARTGDPRALASGLGKLGMPVKAALSIDAVLSLLGDGDRKGKGGGGGGGGGGGRGRGRGKQTRREALRHFWKRLKKLGRGDVSALTEPLAGYIRRAEDHVRRSAPELGTAMVREVAIITGISLTMLGIKMLKLLPGLPFAPGHKGVLLIPLYFAARALARTRFAATLTGLTMGTAAFLLGDGRWGVFEILKHVAPGILIDILMPIFLPRPAKASIWAWSLVGIVVALGRFATVTAIALTVQAPALVFAFLIPGLAIHATFGALSGIVTAPLVRSLLRQSAKQTDEDDTRDLETSSESQADSLDADPRPEEE